MATSWASHPNCALLWPDTGWWPDGSASKSSRDTSEPTASSTYSRPLWVSLSLPLCLKLFYLPQFYKVDAAESSACTHFSGVTLRHCQAQIQPSASEQPTFHWPLSAAFTCPWSFLPWPQKCLLCTRLLRQRLYINAWALRFLFQKQSIRSCLKVPRSSLSLHGAWVAGSHWEGPKTWILGRHPSTWNTS